MREKEYQTIIILLSVIAILLAGVASIVFVGKYRVAHNGNLMIAADGNTINGSTENVKTTNGTTDNTASTDVNSGSWTIDSLKEGMLTEIDYTVQYNENIKSLSAAEKKLSEYGKEQRKKYDNPKVEKIEKNLEKEYGIFAVNLGEMDEETALDVERAVSYMFDTYPQIKGTLTNITLANIDSFSTGHLAITDCREYVINGQITTVPYVMKHEILLSAASFLNRDNLLKKCEDGVATGHWMEGTDISALVVHELGHQLLNAYEMEQLGYNHPYYVTSENEGAFSLYITDHLKVNQTIAKSIMDEAYDNWLKKNSGKSYEDFCRTISDYATGIQSDGGISYSETFAEAVADVYLHGDGASDASKCILEVVCK